MGETIVMDTNVLKDISRGNQALADEMQKQIRSGNTVYISQAAYNELTDPSINPQRGSHYREMLKDMRIQVAPPGSFEDRLKFHEKNMDHVPAPAKPGQQQEPGQIKDYGSAKSGKPGDAFVAAQTKALNAKLWTTDEKLHKRAANLGVSVMPFIKGVSGDEDPARGRKLLGLPPIEINVQGQVTKKYPLGPIPGVAGTTPVAPVDVGPSARGQAKVAGIGIALAGANLILNKINDKIQKGRVEEAIASHWHVITETRQKNTGMGILIIVMYRQTQVSGATADSIIRPGREFDYIVWGKGRTRDEARQEAMKTPTLRAGLGKDAVTVTDESWLPPLDGENITGVKTPFPVLAVGRFALNKDSEATFQNVKFDTIQGFDDNWQTSRKLPEELTPEFAILGCPAAVKWYNLNGSQTTKVQLKSATTSNGNTISVVDLDAYSIGSAAAAMIFPMNKDAELVFATVQTTEHNGLLGHYINFGMARWARAQEIQLVRFVENKP